MPVALPLLLTMLTSATPPPFTVELVPPPLLGPFAASVRLRYVATRAVPFLTSSFEWDLLGRRIYFEPHKKAVDVPLRLEGGVLRADGLEREAGGLSRWTLRSVELQYGPYSFAYGRSSLHAGLAVWEHRPRLDVLVPSGDVLGDGTTLLRIIPTGPAPAPRVDRLPVGAGGLAEVALVSGVELEPVLRDAFQGQSWGHRLRDTPARLEAVLVEERDLPPADPVPEDLDGAQDAAVPAALRLAELTREEWASLRARAARRPGLSVSWAFVEEPDQERRTRLALRAEGGFEPVVLLVTTFFDAQRSVRPAAIRLVPGKAPPASDGRKERGATMTDPSAQPGWSDYKAAWELAGAARSDAALQELLRQTPARWSSLDGHLDEPLLDDLELLVRIRAANRRAALAPGRGDRVATDWSGELLDTTEHLERTGRVVARLRALCWSDPWIEKVLAADAAFLVQVVTDQADQVELRTGKATDPVKAARALVARIGPSISRAER